MATANRPQAISDLGIIRRVNCTDVQSYHGVSEWVIKFKGLSGDSGQRGPYSPCPVMEAVLWYHWRNESMAWETDILLFYHLCDYYCYSQCKPFEVFNMVKHHAAMSCLGWGTTWRHMVMVMMMKSSNGNIFCVTGHWCGEFTAQWWIPRTKASVAELWWFLWSVPE